MNWTAVPRPLVACAVMILGSGLAVEASSPDDLPPPAARTVDFATEIRPILEARCIECHGPEKVRGGLRLDNGPDARAGGESGPSFEAGKSEESLLVEKVAGLDPASIMPPKGERLTAEQIGLIRAWIDQGAKWPDATGTRSSSQAAKEHWAFQAPRRPALPTVSQPSWCRNPIDRFVMSRLDREGLTPSPEADRATLIRRLSLDLTGLPPTPDQVDAFEADTRPDAYERLVDRLLSSPAYGERWARRWLDLARYADTNGYEKDRERSIWPYRDWVIQSLNADLPFDQFSIQQIAGDMLPGDQIGPKLATGFHRNTMINEEGGIDVEEFRFAAMVDRVATTGTVWLGLTVGCAQCHNHKYDPISHRDYYGLMALLDNADEPDLVVPDPAIESRRREILGQIADLESQLPERFPLPAADVDADQPDATRRARHLDAKQEAWERSIRAVRWTPVAPASVRSLKGATMDVLDDRSVLVSGDKPNNDVYEVELSTDLTNITAIRLEVLPHESLPDGGPGRAPLFSVGDFLLTEFTATGSPADGSTAASPLRFSSASEDFSQAGHPAALAIDGVPDTGWNIQGAVGKPHAAVFELAEPLHHAAGSKLTLRIDQEYIHQTTIGRFRISLTGDSKPVKASGVPAEIEDALLVDRSARSAEQTANIRRHYLSIAPELADARKPIDDLRASLPKHPTSMVMQERRPEHRRTTHLRKRGEFLSRAQAVEPAVPAWLHSLPSGAPTDRVALARWLVDNQNPLVGRVVMNRAWQAFFGRGLVGTVEDFGTRGEPPTHPELLDWLATEFVERGWSQKAMHRLILTSATYRQTSRASAELASRDPRNELLARGPRFRVEAEVVRDLALASAGLLDRRIGGPSVYPPQPEGATALAYGQAGWPTSQGPDRYRRGLYTFIKRTAPYAAFTTFDMPTSETVCARRERSNTPLQALTLLNDAVFVEAAQSLARRALGELPANANSAARAERLFRLCLSRRPEADEVRALVDFHDQQLARVQSGELDAAALAGPQPAAAHIDRAELAAWAATARALLNLDETVTRE